jgi:hypothetical protein
LGWLSAADMPLSEEKIASSTGLTVDDVKKTLAKVLCVGMVQDFLFWQDSGWVLRKDTDLQLSFEEKTDHG